MSWRLRKAGEWEGEQRQEEEGITSLKRTLVFEMFASFIKQYLYLKSLIIFQVKYKTNEAVHEEELASAAG